MGALSIWHVVILAGIAVLLFGGGGKISDLMGDVAKGIKAFRRALTDPEGDNPQIRAVASERIDRAAPHPSPTRE